MKKSGSPTILFKNLDLSPLHSILWKGLHWEGPGRPVKYDPACDFLVLMLRQLEQIPYVKDLVKRLRRSRSMRRACGYGRAVSTEAHFSQMKQRLGVEGFRSVEAWPRHEALRLRGESAPQRRRFGPGGVHVRHGPSCMEQPGPARHETGLRRSGRAR